jgi:hypothetical protein
VAAVTNGTNPAFLMAPESFDAGGCEAIGNGRRRRRVEIGEEPASSGNVFDVGDPLDRFHVVLPCGDDRFDSAHRRERTGHP